MRRAEHIPSRLIGRAKPDGYEKMWNELKEQVTSLMQLQAGCEQTPQEKHDDEVFNTVLMGVLNMMDDIEKA